MTRTETLRRLTAKEAEKLLAGRDYPIEQSAAWARYEKALGHQVWGRYVYEDGQQPVAYCTPTRLVAAPSYGLSTVPSGSKSSHPSVKPTCAAC